MRALHTGLLGALVVRGRLGDHSLNAWWAAILLTRLEEKRPSVLLVSLNELTLR